VKIGKNHTFCKNRGFTAMARHGRHISRRGEGLCSVWLAMRISGSPWRELQVLTRIFAMASEILAMASSA
jgi:hypothetical protein